MSGGSPVPEDVQGLREAATVWAGWLVPRPASPPPLLGSWGWRPYADQHVVDSEERGRLDEIDAIIEEASGEKGVSNG